MSGQDDIGSRGESLFAAMVTRYCGRNLPYFRPRFLGEKAHALDFLVELVGTGDRMLFFFAQVKTTRLGYTKGNARSRVGISARDLIRLSLVPAPTYLIGIDEVGEVGYLLAALDGMTGRLSSMPTRYPLDCPHLERLYREVERYWASHDMTRRQSDFSA